METASLGTQQRQALANFTLTFEVHVGGEGQASDTHGMHISETQALRAKRTFLFHCPVRLLHLYSWQNLEILGDQCRMAYFEHFIKHDGPFV